MYYAEFLILAIWTKKPIKHEYMMDLGENYFGEFLNCIFLLWKTQNICVLFWDLTDRYIYLLWMMLLKLQARLPSIIGNGFVQSSQA